MWFAGCCRVFGRIRLGNDELINYLLAVFTGKLEHSDLTALIQASVAKWLLMRGGFT